MDRGRLGQRQRPARRAGPACDARRGDHHRSARAPAAGAARHRAAEQAHRLGPGPGRGRFPAGVGAVHRCQPLVGRPGAAEVAPQPCARPGAGRPARHRFNRPAGADAGRPRGQAADRRGQLDREGIPGARAPPAPGARWRADAAAPGDARAAPWPGAGRPPAKARAGQLGQRGPAALRAARGPQAPDPPHVRAGGPGRDRPQACAHRQRGAGQAARRPVALPAARRAFLMAAADLTAGASAAPPAPRPPHAFAALVLALLMGLQPVTTDLMLPALPALAADLQAGMAPVQLTMSALILAFGVAQLVWGPVADRVGRRPVLLLGLALYALAILGAALAGSVMAVVVWRALQGAAMSAAVVCARAVV